MRTAAARSHSPGITDCSTAALSESALMGVGGCELCWTTLLHTIKKKIV
jgi:hypothetical protein